MLLSALLSFLLLASSFGYGSAASCPCDVNLATICLSDTLYTDPAYVNADPDCGFMPKMNAVPSMRNVIEDDFGYENNVTCTTLPGNIKILTAGYDEEVSLLCDDGTECNPNDSDPCPNGGSCDNANIGRFGKLTFRVEGDRCLAHHEYDIGPVGHTNRLFFRDYYEVNNISPSEAAACRQEVQSACTTYT